MFTYPFQCFSWTRYQFFFSISSSYVVVYCIVYNIHTHTHITIQNIWMNVRHLYHFSLDLTLLKSTSIWKWRWNSIGTFSLYYNMFVSHGTFANEYVQTHTHIFTFTHISWPKIESQKNHSTRKLKPKMNWQKWCDDGKQKEATPKKKIWDIEGVAEKL